MSTEGNKAVARRYFEIARNGSLEPDALAEVIAPNVVDHTAAPGQAPGLAGFQEFFATLRAGFPDFEVTVDDVIAEGDKVVARFTFRGTHRGEFMDIPPSDRRVTIGGIDIFRIADGKIVELWGQEDLLGMLQQLGVAPDA